MEKLRNRIERICEGGIVIFLSALFLISLTGTHHNIVWYKEFFVTLCMLCLILAVWILLKKREAVLVRKEKKLLAVLISVWFLALYAFSCLARNIPIHDYAAVYGSAKALAYGEGTVLWEYLARWKNNFPIFLLLSAGMKACAAAGAEDPFYLLLAVNTGLTVWGGIGTYQIAGLLFERRYRAFLALLFYMGFIPCWGMTNGFYTDSVSISFGVWAAYLALLAGKKAERRWPCLFLAGMIWGFGFSVKATCAISMIALFLTWIRTCRWAAAVKQVGLILLGFGVMAGAWSAVRTAFPCYELEEELGAPLEFWIALGMEGDGAYHDEFALPCLAIPGKEAKREYARACIAERMPNLFQMSHIVSKARYNFASGNMGLSEYHAYPVTPFYEFFNSYGAYNGYVTMVTSGYFYALWTLGLGGYVWGLAVSFRTGGRPEAGSAMILLTVAGIFLFLMIWEANNRQLYNHIPWFALFAVSGIVQIAGGAMEKSGKEKI